MHLTIRVVVDQVKAFLVVESGHMRLRNTEADRVGEALAKRTGGDFNAIGVSSFGVTRGQRIKLAECLEIIDGQLVAEQMEEDVQKSTAARGEINSDGTQVYQTTYA